MIRKKAHSHFNWCTRIHFSFFYITKRKMKQIEAMAEGVKEIEKGNLAYRIEKKGEDEIASLTENINNMAEEPYE